MKQGMYETIVLAENVWAVEMQMVRAFLVVGGASALLIDTGAGGVNLVGAVRACTDLPISVVNTHAHYDHISGNGAFSMRFAHPKECAALMQAGFETRPVGDGFGFDLGGVMLRVVGLPGHTPGSVGLWDAERGLLFAGDTVARNAPIHMYTDGASLEAYGRSLDKILALEDPEQGGRPARIFCCHGTVETDASAVRALKALLAGMAEGTAEKAALQGPFAARLPEGVRKVALGDVAILTW